MCTGLAAIINIFFNFLLIPKYGMVGAGYSTAISYLFLTVSYFYNSQKFVKLQIDWQKILKMLLLSLLVIFLAPKFWKFSYPVNLAIKISEVSAYVILLYLTGVIEKSEWGYLMKYIRQILKMQKSNLKN